jgi:hypothetical protein
MHPYVAAFRLLSGAAYIPAGVITAYYGLYSLGAATVAYGFVDALWHECDNAGIGGRCVAGILYDYGFLSFIDLYLQRIVSLLSLTAFIFRPGLARLVARTLLSTVALFVSMNRSISMFENDCVMAGTYVALWIFGYVLRSAPKFRKYYAWASVIIFLFAVAARYIQDQFYKANDSTEALMLTSTAHLLYATDIVLVALALHIPEGSRAKEL